MEKRLYFNLHENMSSIKTEPLKETFYLAHSRTTTESQEPLRLCQDHYSSVKDYSSLDLCSPAPLITYSPNIQIIIFSTLQVFQFQV